MVEGPVWLEVGKGKAGILCHAGENVDLVAGDFADHGGWNVGAGPAHGEPVGQAGMGANRQRAVLLLAGCQFQDNFGCVETARMQATAKVDGTDLANQRFIEPGIFA